MPLENKEWEALQNMKWGALINETYDDTDSVGYFTNFTTRILQNSRCVGGI